MVARLKLCYLTDFLLLQNVVKCGPRKNTGGGNTLMQGRMSRAEKSDLELPSDDETDNADERSCQDVCAICLGEYQVGDQICWSNNQSCTHHFHATCGIAWLAKHSDCPVCRSDYLVEPPEIMSTMDVLLESLGAD